MANGYDMSLFEKMKPNQALFVQHLRKNPNNVTQIEGLLADDYGNMCAMGMGLEAFGMLKRYQQTKDRADSGFDPHAYIAKTLDMPEDHVSQAYTLNDTYSLSFAEIADIMEEYFSQGVSYSADRVVFYLGPEEIWEKQQNAEEDERADNFAEVWETHRQALEKVLSEARLAFSEFGYVGKSLVYAEVLESGDPREFFDDYLRR